MAQSRLTRSNLFLLLTQHCRSSIKRSQIITLRPYLTSHGVQEEKNQLKRAGGLERTMRPKPVNADAYRKVAQNRDGQNWVVWGKRKINTQKATKITETLLGNEMKLTEKESLEFWLQRHQMVKSYQRPKVDEDVCENIRPLNLRSELHHLVWGRNFIFTLKKIIVVDKLRRFFRFWSPK